MAPCIFRLDGDCHATKKGHVVCKTCWSRATAEKQESLKDHADYHEVCKAFGCWEYITKGRYCDRHADASRSRSPPLRVRERSVTPEPTREQPQDAHGLRMDRCSVSTLVAHIQAFVQELERRAIGHN